MPDMKKWLETVKWAVNEVADEELQRRSWFGEGPEIGSPDEVFNRFFGDAAVEQFLQQNDTELDDVQLENLRKLLFMMEALADQTPNSINERTSPDFINDVRWIAVRETAKQTLESLKRFPKV